MISAARVQIPHSPPKTAKLRCLAVFFYAQNGVYFLLSKVKKWLKMAVNFFELRPIYDHSASRSPELFNGGDGCTCGWVDVSLCGLQLAVSHDLFDELRGCLSLHQSGGGGMSA